MRLQPHSIWHVNFHAGETHRGSRQCTNMLMVAPSWTLGTNNGIDNIHIYFRSTSWHHPSADIPYLYQRRTSLSTTPGLIKYQAPRIDVNGVFAHMVLLSSFPTGSATIIVHRPKAAFIGVVGTESRPSSVVRYQKVHFLDSKFDGLRRSGSW